MTKKELFIVRNIDDELVAIFTNKDDCKDYINEYYFEKDLDYFRLVI